MINWINVQKMVKVVSGSEGEGPPATCQPVSRALRTSRHWSHLTGGPYHSPLERRPGWRNFGSRCVVQLQVPAQSQVLPHPVPSPSLEKDLEGGGVGTVRPLPVLCSHTRVKAGPAEPVGSVPAPMEAPPTCSGPSLGRVPLCASVVADPRWCRLRYHAREFSARPYLQNPRL